MPVLSWPLVLFSNDWSPVPVLAKPSAPPVPRFENSDLKPVAVFPNPPVSLKSALKPVAVFSLALTPSTLDRFAWPRAVLPGKELTSTKASLTPETSLGLLQTS